MSVLGFLMGVVIGSMAWLAIQRTKRPQVWSTVYCSVAGLLNAAIWIFTGNTWNGIAALVCIAAAWWYCYHGVDTESRRKVR